MLTLMTLQFYPLVPSLVNLVLQGGGQSVLPATLQMKISNYVRSSDIVISNYKQCSKEEGISFPELLVEDQTL
jgi:hypothetical protein